MDIPGEPCKGGGSALEDRLSRFRGRSGESPVAPAGLRSCACQRSRRRPPSAAPRSTVRSVPRARRSFAPGSCPRDRDEDGASRWSRSRQHGCRAGSPWRRTGRSSPRFGTRSMRLRTSRAVLATRDRRCRAAGLTAMRIEEADHFLHPARRTLSAISNHARPSVS